MQQSTISHQIDLIQDKEESIHFCLSTLGSFFIDIFNQLSILSIFYIFSKKKIFQFHWKNVGCFLSKTLFITLYLALIPPMKKRVFHQLKSVLTVIFFWRLMIGIGLTSSKGILILHLCQKHAIFCIDGIIRVFCQWLMVEKLQDLELVIIDG